MVQYDPKIIQQHAEKLYRSANLIVLVCVLGFGLPGVLLATMTDHGGAWFVALLLAAIGAAVGTALAFNLKLKAQLALCQMRTESNTAALLGVRGTQHAPPG